MDSPSPSIMPATATAPAPPPPRRSVTALRSSASSSSTPITTTQDSTLWSKTTSKSRQTWDSLYKVADKVGYWSNQKASQVGVEAFYPTSLDIECVKCARICRMMSAVAVAAHAPQDTLEDSKKAKQTVLHKIPASVFEQAQGVAIFTVFRTGFVVSGSGGSGIVIARDDKGQWTAPSGILLHTIGFGFLAGIDVYDVVLILRTRAAVQAFSHPRVSLGAELGVTAGPMGAGHMVETSIDKTPSPVWAYTKSRGAYAGVALEGTVFIERNDENARSYGRQIKATEILSSSIPPPPWCQGDFPHLPSSDSDSDLGSISARRWPRQDLDDADLQEIRKMQESLHSLGVEDGLINAHNRQADALMVQGVVEEQGRDNEQPSTIQTNAKPQSQVSATIPLASANVILSEVTDAPPSPATTSLSDKRRSLPPPVPPRRTPRLGHDGKQDEPGSTGTSRASSLRRGSKDRPSGLGIDDEDNA
ncbi:hypothetical protein OIO90_005089 [Microbotryomycetes sp. JL221]|nr:hypothetical protein OIO90_005089 [Microbotryomycetes sp. JL221]